jgi:hypothetical protein
MGPATSVLSPARYNRPRPFRAMTRQSPPVPPGRDRLRRPNDAAPSNIQNYSLAEGIGGVYLLVPKTINVNAPAFRQAANACDFH